MTDLVMKIDVMDSGVFARTSPSYDLGAGGIPYSFLFGGDDQEDISGVHVDEWSALRIPPYWRAINFMCDTFAKVPLHVMKVDKDGGSEPDKNHPAYNLLRRRASKTQIAFHWKRQVLFHALEWGNYIGRIRRNILGEPVAIESLDPRTTVLGKTKDGRLMYATPTGDGRVAMVLPENIFHIFGLSFDGMWGLRPMEFFQYSMGKASAHLQYAASFYGRGANPSGILRAPSGLSEDDLKRFKDSFDEAYAGLKNSNRLLLLEDDAEFIPTTVKPRDAQYAEGNDLTARDVCNLFGLPPATMALQDSQSYNSLEIAKQSELDAVDPWLCQMEEVASAKLLTERQLRLGTHKVKARREALKVIDHRTNVEMGLRELEHGVLLLNEYRNAHDRGALPEEVNRPRMPRNIGYADEDQQQDQQQQQQQDRQQDQQQQQEAENAVYLRFLASAENKFKAQARKACKKPSTFIEFIDSGYRVSLDSFLESVKLVETGAEVSMIDSVVKCVLNFIEDMNRLSEESDNLEQAVDIVEAVNFEWEKLLCQKKS